MVTIFLCDDDEAILGSYSNKLKNLAEKNGIEINLNFFKSGESLLFYLFESTEKADIIYMDIIMGDLNGIETAKKIREIGCRAEIIFLTETEDYVYDAYDISPVHYLLKTKTSEEKFEEVFLRAIKRTEKKAKEIFVCEYGGNIKVIPIADISYFEIWKRVVSVHYGDNKIFSFYSTMEKLGSQLGETFIRTHRSYMVNLSYVSKFQRTNLILKTGEAIPVGITYGSNVRESFLKYLGGTNDCGEK